MLQSHSHTSTYSCMFQSHSHTSTYSRMLQSHSHTSTYSCMLPFPYIHIFMYASLPHPPLHTSPPPPTHLLQNKLQVQAGCLDILFLQLVDTIQATDHLCCSTKQTQRCYLPKSNIKMNKKITSECTILHLNLAANILTLLITLLQTPKPCYRLLILLLTITHFRSS